MSTLKSQERHGSRLVKKNSSSTTAPVKRPACTTSRPTDKSTILETNHNRNAVTNTNTPNASFMLSSKVNTSSKIIKKEFHSNSSTFFSNVSNSSPSTSNSENNSSIINLLSWDEFLSDHEEVIPPDASLLPLSFVAIPGMKISVENGTILNMDIAEIKHKVGDQLRVLIYKP